MPKLELPFEARVIELEAGDLLSAGLYPMLPKGLKEVARANVFLLKYLHMLPVEEIGIPRYYEFLARSLSEEKLPNLIYPVKGGTFTHIYPDPGNERHTYISVEPILTANMDEIMPKVEEKLMDFTEEFARNVTDEERRESFLSVIERICIAKDGRTEKTAAGDGRSPSGEGKWVGFRGKWYGGDGRFAGLKGKLQAIRGGLFARKTGDRMELSSGEIEAVKYLIVRDKVGVGVLEPLVQDIYIEDISGSGVGPIFVEHKIFRSLKTAVTFTSMEELDDFAMRLSERIKRPVTLHSPIVDASLPDGSRINIVYGQDVSKRGTSFSIRRFSEVPTSIMQVIEFGTMNYQMAAYLSLALEEHMNIFIAGETASGKTTTLNAITTFIKPESKIVSIEDTPELQVPHKNWLREISRDAKKGQRAAEVGMFDLLRAALRQRPNMIVIGEIRGAEGLIAFQAMQTGHGVMSTFHAASVEKLIQRLTGDPINVPKSYVDCLNIAIIQSAVKLPNGKPARRVLSISEILGYDPASQSFSFLHAFMWNQAKDVFEFTANMNSYLLEEKIAPKRGIPPEKKRNIYNELNRRARILERLHKEKGISDFYELLGVLSAARKEGVF
ncbi:MAG TPA: secretion system protein E [Dehalococcoidia bacterium]|nr:secretion system protein E [Dehalococcoidia bacterium]